MYTYEMYYIFDIEAYNYAMKYARSSEKERELFILPLKKSVKNPKNITHDKLLAPEEALNQLFNIYLETDLKDNQRIRITCFSNPIKYYEREFNLTTNNK